jgi:hypothetical protein
MAEKNPKLDVLNVPEGDDIFKHLAKLLIPHKASPVGSHLFVVEGTIDKPRIGIRYPGRKLRFRTEVKKANKNTAMWANLLDFEVIPFDEGEPGLSVKFTYDNLLKDFEEHKKDSEEFWKIILELHEHNRLPEILPNLLGMDTRLFLEMLKWMWLQEDTNYKLSWEEVDSPIRYRLETKKQKPTGKGAGRDKFFAALILVKGGYFKASQIKKIIP